MQVAISTHLFLYHDLLGDSVIEAVTEHGFYRLELWAMRPHLPYRDENRINQISELMRRRGVEAVSAHLPLYRKVHRPGERKETLSPSDLEDGGRRTWVDEALRAAEASRKLGATLLTLHTDLPFTTGSENRETAFHKSMSEMLEALPDSAYRLAVENTLFGTRNLEDLLRIITPYPKERVGITLDVGHAHIGGNVIEAVQALASRLLSVHLHDNDGVSDAHLPPGKGTVPWSELVKTLDETGFHGPLVWEIRDPTAGNDPGLVEKRGILNQIHDFDTTP